MSNILISLKLTLEFSDFGIGDVGINDVEEISEFFAIPNKADLRNHVSIGTLTWFSDRKPKKNFSETFGGTFVLVLSLIGLSSFTADRLEMQFNVQLINTSSP